MFPHRVKHRALFTCLSVYFTITPGFSPGFCPHPPLFRNSSIMHNIYWLYEISSLVKVQNFYFHVLTNAVAQVKHMYILL